MTIPYTYNYSAQLKKYIGQFLRVFSGIQVRAGVDRSGTGVNDTRIVSVVYGNSDRIINALNQNQGTFTAQRLPIVSAYMTGLQLADDYRISRHHEENVTYQNSADGEYHTVGRIIGTPITVTMNLYIYASSTDQMFQILEQILLYFNPTIDFQKSSGVLDWSYITQCTLTNIGDQNNFPIGQSRRIVQQNLTFSFVAWVNYPYTDAAGVIQDIITNIHDSSSVTEELDLLTPPPAGPTIETTTVDSSTVIPPKE